MLAGVEQRVFELPERDLAIAALDWGGQRPVALLHHANGFCAATWALLAADLRDRYRVIALDARGHGDSSKPEEVEAYGWTNFVDDLIAVAERITDETGEAIALGVGNSFGGTLTMCAAAERPSLFARVVMLDPVIRPTPELLATHGLESQFAHFASGGPNLIAEQARRRRAVWPSREAARESWASKEMFSPWDPRALDLYVDYAMRERADGQVELKCPPAIEAAIFDQNSQIDAFAYAERVRAPTLVVAAERGRFPVVLFELLGEALPAGRTISVPIGHLLPMEEPKATAELLLKFGDEHR